MTAPTAMRTRDVLARLERHYIKPGADLPGGVFLPEVTLGRQGGPRADAIFAGFTSTSGRLLVGHEIKVSRSDWLHELDQPHKADAWESQCHAWYVVAPGTDVVKPEELPHGWGLLTCDGRTTTRCNVTVKATVHQDRQPSWQATLSLLSKQDTLRANLVHQARRKALDDAMQQLDERVERQVTDQLARRGNVEALQQRLELLEQGLGVTVTLDRYSMRDNQVTAADVREVGDLLRAHQTVKEAARHTLGRYSLVELRHLRTQLDELSAALQAYKALVGDPEEVGA